MESAITEPRGEVSAYAPRIYTVSVPLDKIRDIIGPGGKTIRNIVAQTGVKVDVEDDGRVFVASPTTEAAEKALAMINDLVREVAAGEIFSGKVTRLMAFGAFVEVLPGKEGLLHVSEISTTHVGKVDDVLSPGDMVLVIVKEIDDMGRINLSRRRVLEKKNDPAIAEKFADAFLLEDEREARIKAFLPLLNAVTGAAGVVLPGREGTGLPATGDHTMDREGAAPATATGTGSHDRKDQAWCSQGQRRNILSILCDPFFFGVDLRASESLTIPPGGRTPVGTGIRLEIPEGYECQVRPRSGLALKHGVTVLNAPGTIDSDYRGEVRVILVNLGEEPFRIER